MINPYELLGVTINTSKDDIKKIYYQLSLLAHPDKGGNNDDMITLKKAYDFVIKEINNINNTVTVEELEAKFKEFCKTQENNVPLFQDIYAEAFNLEKFNDYFDKYNNNTEPIGNFLKGGYGDMMEKTSISDLEYKDTENVTVTHQFTTTLTNYTAPKETQVLQHLLDYSNKEPIDDYSLDVGTLQMSDYKAAFILDNKTNLQQINPRDEINVPNKTLEELIKERSELSNIESKQEYTWSYEGVIDSARNLVKNFFKLQ